MSEPYLIKPAEGRALDLYDTRVWIKTTAGAPGAYSLIEGVWQPGGFDPLPHIHQTEDESFYVLEGEFDFQVGETTLRGNAGTFVFVPKGVLHKFRVLWSHRPPTSANVRVAFFSVAVLLAFGIFVLVLVARGKSVEERDVAAVTRNFILQSFGREGDAGLAYALLDPQTRERCT